MGIAFGLVICSGALHAIWNLFTKRSHNKNAFLWHSQWMAILLYLPWILRDLPKIVWEPTTVLLLLLSMIIHTLYMILLAKAYTIGDLSLVYPIMRGTSPLVVPLVGVLLLHEHLSLWGWCGIGLIMIGIVMLSEFQAWTRNAASSKAIVYAFAVGVCISAYIVVDSIALTYIPLVPLNAASNLGILLGLTWLVIRSGKLGDEWKMNKWTIMLVGLLAPGGYLIFLLALKFAPVSALAPMREIGTAFGALLGVWLLKEAKGASRITAALFITIGVIVIGIS